MRARAMAQVNGILGPGGELLCVGVASRQVWLKANARIGLDFEVNPVAIQDGVPLTHAPEIDLATMTARVRAQNALIRIRVTPAGLVTLHVDLLDRWAHMLGLRVRISRGRHQGCPGQAGVLTRTHVLCVGLAAVSARGSARRARS